MARDKQIETKNGYQTPISMKMPMVDSRLRCVDWD